MTYRIETNRGGFTVGTQHESITIRHDGKDYNAQVVRAVNDNGVLCFILEYRWRDWNPPIFGKRDWWFVLDTRQHIIGKGVNLDEALAKVKL